jgi:hypothetical protein
MADGRSSAALGDARGSRTRDAFALQPRDAFSGLDEPRYAETIRLTCFLPTRKTPRMALAGRSLRRCFLDCQKCLPSKVTAT